MTDAQKVNWIRQQTLQNGTQVAISEKSGIVKVTLPGMQNRTIMAYADEFIQLGCTVDLQRYFEANADVALSRDASKDTRQIKRTQEKSKLKAAQALHDLGVNVDDLNAFLASKKQA